MKFNSLLVIALLMFSGCGDVAEKMIEVHDYFDADKKAVVDWRLRMGKDQN